MPNYDDVARWDWEIVATILGWPCFVVIFDVFLLGRACDFDEFSWVKAW